ncbi:hypothetical protein QQZ08_005145 [Neonectria magnoliae]|uniref:Uncharacterized protein n=1 Tax=Neonectria magnoliae TaxID=2732573 RepID=A0ABR1I653_9HYPO
MSTNSIVDWMKEIPEGFAEESPLESAPPSRKRRRLNPTTPDSFNDNDVDQNILIMPLERDESPSKCHAPADDETPRAPHKRIQAPRSESNYSLSGRSQQSFQSSEPDDFRRRNICKDSSSALMASGFEI